MEHLDGFAYADVAWCRLWEWGLKGIELFYQTEWKKWEFLEDVPEGWGRNWGWQKWVDERRKRETNEMKCYLESNGQGNLQCESPGFNINCVAFVGLLWCRPLLGLPSDSVMTVEYLYTHTHTFLNEYGVKQQPTRYFSNCDINFKLLLKSVIYTKSYVSRVYLLIIGWFHLTDIRERGWLLLLDWPRVE